MIKFSKLLSLTFATLSLLILPSCNTLAGVGRDMSCLGCQLADTANRGFFAASAAAPATTATVKQ